MNKQALKGIDELNKLFSDYEDSLNINSLLGDEGEETPLKTSEEQEDIIMDLLIMAYMYGDADAKEQLGSSGKPDVDKMRKAIDMEIAGKNWRTRLKDVYGNRTGTAGKDILTEINRIAITEGMRVYNTAVLDTALANGGVDKFGNPIYKVWNTLKDDKVRDSHAYLDGMKVSVKDNFYTYDGYSAPYPHAFGIPQEDINCRCYITLTGKS